uniref:Uncharacterized protein n=1 Tax=Phlebotomus papatasi TaxID=29031 RepID=A0A3F2ZEL9_PHLPP
MKKFNLILISLLLVNLGVCEKNTEKSYKIPKVKFGNPLSKAMATIIKTFYSIESTQLTIVRAADNHENEILQSGIINEILYDVKGLILIRLQSYDSREHSFRRYFNVLVVDSYESFRKILNGGGKDAFDFTGYYTIILTSVVENYREEVYKILKDCYRSYIINANVITFDPSNIEKAFVFTYFPYTTKHCNHVKPVVNGVFENETLAMYSKLFSNKVSNFHRCNITVGTIEYPPFMILKYQGNGSYYYDGFEGIITRVLGQRLNFSLILKTSVDRWGVVNGENSTGLSRLLLKGEVNFTIGSFAATFSHNGSFTNTISYYGTPLTLLVPPGRAYTHMEKLFLPMKYIIWSCISTIFILSAVVVSISKFIRPHRRAFIFGRKNYFPYINTINVFLGGVVPITPMRNFARFLLMLWILSSLVIRSSYQGSLFNFLKDHRNASIADTFPKMIKEGFKIYGSEAIRKYFSSNDVYLSVFRNISVRELEDYKMKSTTPGFKGAVVASAFNIAYLNEKYHSHNIRFRRSKEQIVLLYICIYLRKYSYLTKPFDKELWRYVESGLINRWLSVFYNKQYLKDTPDKSIPQALTFDQLSGIFMAYVILLVFSFMVFLLEVLSRKSRVLRALCNFLN